MNEVLKFWFEELTQKQWWMKDDNIDRTIKERFSQILNQARLGELYTWRTSPEGRLAEIIVLDQFSRNIFRDHPGSFAQDPMALTLSQEAVSLQEDLKLDTQKRLFLYMPYMHSESKIVHQEAVRLFEGLGLKGNLEFEHKHKKIIDQFGRYPHRNEILSRKSTPDELAFLDQPGSSF